MSNTPNFDAKIKALLDATKPGERVCPISGERWTLTADDIAELRKWNVPPPIYAPSFRLKCLAAGMSGIDLWYRPHALTGKIILCSSDADSSQPVVEDAEWYGLDEKIIRGIEYDPNKKIFAHLIELTKIIPIQALYTLDVENVVGGGIQHSSNSFMIFGTYYTKDSFYTFRSKKLDRCLDCVFTEESTEAYSCAMAVRLYKCIQVFHSIDCISSAFLFDCRNCEDCFCSSNLRNRRFVFKNKQLSETEYRQQISIIDLSLTSIFEDWKCEFNRFIRENSFWPENFNIKSDESLGEYLLNCINCTGWYGNEAQNSRNLFYSIGKLEECNFVAVSEYAQDTYESSGVFNSQDIKFSLVAIKSKNLEYCINCRNCEFCFGCNGLQNKKYHIFNKPYEEREFWEKVDQIKCQMIEYGEYGIFMPLECSSWHPEVSLGSLICPFSEEELLKLHVRRLDLEKALRFAPYSQIKERGDITQVPNAVKDVTEEWDKVIFDDPEQKRPFMVNKMEREFRQKLGLPFPRQHYRGRLLDLIMKVNSPERMQAVCAECGKEIMVNKNRAFPNRKILCLKHYYKFLEENG